MRSLRRFFVRLVNFATRRRDDERLREEIEGHLALEAAENQRAGLSPAEARRQALLTFGPVEAVKEDYRAERGMMFMETLLQDVRYAFHILRKSPGFTAVAVLTLALGIGANTAIFSVVDAVLLKPLRFERPASLAIIWESLPKYGIDRNTVSPANFLDWQDQNRAFSGMAAFLDQPTNLTGTGQPEQVDVECVSANFFSILGVEPVLGRAFSREESANPAKANVVVLSYGLWKSKFGADPNIVGRSIELNGESATVIGLMGADFDLYIDEFSMTHERPQVWAPLDVRPEWHDRTKVGRFLRVIARVKPELSLAQAQAEMNVVAAGLAARYPESDKGWGIALVPLHDQLSGAFRPALLILLGSVGFVLLIACANVSSLLLSRAAGRRREIAIRVALGASRRRIVQQLLTESVLLGVIGGVLGAFFALWTTEAFVQAAPPSLLDFAAVSINWRIFAFAAGVTLAAGLLAGFLPSFMGASANAASALPEGDRTSSAGRKSLVARSSFVISEVSLALVLLAGSSLLIQSFFRLMHVDAGFQVSHLLTFQISLPSPKYNEQARSAFFEELLRKIRTLPGAISTSADVTPPFSGVGAATDFAIVGEPVQPVGEAHGTAVRVVESDYFRTMGIPLLHGRTFDGREFAQQRNVVVINRAFAEKYFPGKNPLGQKVIIDMKDKNLTRLWAWSATFTNPIWLPLLTPWRTGRIRKSLIPP
jgi:predicted permease